MASDIAEAISKQYLATNPIGRFSELCDPDVLSMIFDCTAAGMSQVSSCEAAGIDRVTLGRWVKRAEEEPTSAYAAFDAALKQCRRQGQLAHLKNIQSHSKTWWQASAWTLERTDPEQFALRKDDAQVPKVVVNIGSGAADVKVLVLSPELVTGRTDP